MDMELNGNSRRIFKFVVEYKKENDGNSPGMDSIAAGCGLSKATVHAHLAKMVACGKIRRGPGHCQIILPDGEYTWHGRISQVIS